MTHKSNLRLDCFKPGQHGLLIQNLVVKFNHNISNCSVEPECIYSEGCKLASKNMPDFKVFKVCKEGKRTEIANSED